MISEDKFNKKDKELNAGPRETLELFLKGKTDKEIALEQNLEESVIRKRIPKLCDHFLGRVPKKEWEELNLSQKRISNEERRGELVKLFYRYKPDLVSPEVLDKYDIETRELQLESPEGTVPLKSPFYVERSPIESFCYQTIIQPGALIPIKAPRQMGKTSLLDRILDYGRQQGYQTVRLNLRQISAEKFANLNTFMRCFCALIRKELPDNLPQIEELWDDEIGSTSATGYLQAILEGLEMPLVLGLDEVDKVFDYAEVYQYFLPLLRAWHEEANSLEIWENLRLIVVHSTEDYGRLDLNQSPFNVRSAVELRDFSPEEIAGLAGRYGLNLSSGELEGLRGLIGGHPYLVRLAFYNLARGDLSLEMLLENGATDAGIYQGHLLRHLDILNGNLDLKAAFKEVIVRGEGVQIDALLSRKLYSMGLIVKRGNLVMPRCPLYRQYFEGRL